jgi:hypothetical protein
LHLEIHTGSNAWLPKAPTLTLQTLGSLVEDAEEEALEDVEEALPCEDDADEPDD